MVLCTIFISSCGINGKQTESEYMTPTEKAESDLMMIVKSINDRNADAIRSLLSRSVCNSVDADSKINEMFEFIDGEIVSYDDPFGSAAGSMEKKDAGARIESFRTDKDTDYYIGIKEWYSYKEQPDQVGIYNIIVKNNSALSGGSDSENAVYRLVPTKYDKP